MTFDRLSGLGAASRVCRTLLIAGAMLAIGSAAAAKPAAPAAQSAAPAAEKAPETTTTVSSSGDDLFLAQRDVRVTKTGAGKVVVMGKTVTYDGAEAKTVVTMGETVRFESGQSSQMLFAGGETVELKSGFKADGDVAAFGKNVTVSSPVNGDLSAGGETVTIDSAVTGSVKVEGEHVIIGPNARIGGDFKYRSDNLEISPQAVITGKQTKLVGPSRHGMSHEPKTLTQQVTDALWGALISAALALGSVLLLPGLVGRAADALAKNPLMPLAVGLVSLIGVPILIILFAVTIIGFPVAIMLGLLYGASFFLAFAVASCTLGGLVRGLVAKSKDAPGFGGRLGWAALGGIILALLGAIPVAGGWISFAACILGLGAVVGALRAKA